ncbi:hypothetical protein PAPYR_13362 [Paratrimastix pyriformis]|uniref:Uncharacterized protein n=1 Tax=Paratrimastix pyriformis TaxID=342808 RepID=A0ABQ8U0E1_9EUKA|nr:hypothetical protein PAPYR_13362 [Paratrimastix pyriformis]
MGVVLIWLSVVDRKDARPPVILATGRQADLCLRPPGRVLEAAAHPGLAQFGVNAIVQFVEPDEDGKSQGRVAGRQG